MSTRGFCLVILALVLAACGGGPGGPTGQTNEAFWNSLRHAEPLSIGLNCALGPKELRTYVEELSNIADVAVSAHPNAGLPNDLGGYDLDAQHMAGDERQQPRDARLRFGPPGEIPHRLEHDVGGEHAEADRDGLGRA